MPKHQIKFHHAEALKRIRKLTEERLEEFADVAVEVAKEVCPRDTGNLARSISHAPGRGGKGRRIFTDTGYGIYPELGTAKQPAHHYMAQGVTAAIDDLAQKEGGSWWA